MAAEADFPETKKPAKSAGWVKSMSYAKMKLPEPHGGADVDHNDAGGFHELHGFNPIKLFVPARLSTPI